MKKAILFLGIACGLVFSSQTSFCDQSRLKIYAENGQLLPLVAEPLDSFSEIPLKNTRDALNKKYKNLQFFSLYSLQVKAGQTVKTNLLIKEKSQRITAAVLFQPFKDGPRYIKIVGSGYFQKNINIQVEGLVPSFKEVIVLFIADATKSAEHLSENLKTILEGEYAEAQIVDFGTDWTMSDVEVTIELNNKKNKQKKESTIVFEDEINKMYAPLWLMSVRLIIEQ